MTYAWCVHIEYLRNNYRCDLHQHGMYTTGEGLSVCLCVVGWTVGMPSVLFCVAAQQHGVQAEITSVLQQVHAHTYVAIGNIS
jgi:hypothetical protein